MNNFDYNQTRIGYTSNMPSQKEIYTTISTDYQPLSKDDMKNAVKNSNIRSYVGSYGVPLQIVNTEGNVIRGDVTNDRERNPNVVFGRVLAPNMISGQGDSHIESQLIRGTITNSRNSENELQDYSRTLPRLYTYEDVVYNPIKSWKPNIKNDFKYPGGIDTRQPQSGDMQKFDTIKQSVRNLNTIYKK